ncbi:hypothetical protein BU26DRAFT_568249 [Trematosphaeria pertusa]|uniref:RING-type domain-containing protein n=1 Tax=Trematosphaeria pertusa TaxID=390896 RepID=A0A6A6I6W6_9PLEO|nr:uncharacterized protein BU26DRAFT_568249 [Trematosphaeria pertusa]KAF2245692.1 hypothetical protein BU26DRAFT_568249 [Trematosphaeria pertusa]
MATYTAAIWHLGTTLATMKAEMALHQEGPIRIRPNHHAIVVFDEMMTKFFKEYTAIMRAYPRESAWPPGIDFPDLGEIRRYHRFLLYQLPPAAGEFFRHIGGDPHVHRLNCGCTRTARLFIAGRIAWLEKRRSEGRELYPTEGRYANPLTDQLALYHALSDDTKWLADFAIPVPLELQYLMIQAFDLHRVLGRLDDRIDRMEAEAVEEVTTECTKEAMASEDTACDICTYAFGPEFSDENMTEPAAKISCGHIFGKQCLQTWFASHNTCPKCRSFAFPTETLLSPALLAPHAQKQEIEHEFRELDTEIDGYFLSTPMHTYGSRMEDMLDIVGGLIEEVLSIEHELDRH